MYKTPLWFASCVQRLSTFQSQEETLAGIQHDRKYSPGSRTPSEFISLSAHSHTKNIKRQRLSTYVWFVGTYTFSFTRSDSSLSHGCAACSDFMLSFLDLQRSWFILFLLAGQLGMLTPSFPFCHCALPLFYSSHVNAFTHFLLFSKIIIIGHFWVRN